MADDVDQLAADALDGRAPEVDDAAARSERARNAARAQWAGLTEEEKAAKIERLTAARRRGGGQKRKADKPPKPRRRPAQTPTPTDSPTDAQLVAMLSEMLSAPAIPAAMILKCEYCAGHFVESAPPTAQNLVAMSVGKPGLRAALLRLYSAYTALSYAGVLGAYVGKPLLHHLAPDDVYRAAAPALGMPPRQHDHETPSATAAGNGASAAPAEAQAFPA